MLNRRKFLKGGVLAAFGAAIFPKTALSESKKPRVIQWFSYGYFYLEAWTTS